MIPSTVLTMIGTMTKGMLMMKLKFGAVALVMGFGIIGSGIGLGVGQPARATDGQTPAGKVETGRVEAPRSSEPGMIESIPTPTEYRHDADPCSTFHRVQEGWPRPLLMKPVIEAMVQKGYWSIDRHRIESPHWRNRFKITVLPTYLFVR